MVKSAHLREYIPVSSEENRRPLEPGLGACSRRYQVVGMVFAEEELELITGGADGTFLVWQMPSLALKQRITRLHTSPLVSLPPELNLVIQTPWQ